MLSDIYHPAPDLPQSYNILDQNLLVFSRLAASRDISALFLKIHYLSCTQDRLFTDPIVAQLI
jgi:hypothetical protein